MKSGYWTPVLTNNLSTISQVTEHQDTSQHDTCGSEWAVAVGSVNTVEKTLHELVHILYL